MHRRQKMCREIGKEKILNRSGNLMSKLSHRYTDKGDKNMQRSGEREK